MKVYHKNTPLIFRKQILGNETTLCRITWYCSGNIIISSGNIIRYNPGTEIISTNISTCIENGLKITALGQITQFGRHDINHNHLFGYIIYTTFEYMQYDLMRLIRLVKKKHSTMPVYNISADIKISIKCLENYNT